jgi:hypothetical protein
VDANLLHPGSCQGCTLGATVASLLAIRDSGAVLTHFVEAEEMFRFCGVSVGTPEPWYRVVGELELCSMPDEISLSLRSRFPVSPLTDVTPNGNADSYKINQATPDVVANRPMISAT